MKEIIENEEWKDIPNYEGLYKISNLGRIKSLERIDARGNRQKEKILKPLINPRGYYQIQLCKQAIVKQYYVHRLVFETFNWPIPENMQVNHINEIKTDNRLENLNIMTRKENCNWGSRNERSVKKRINGKCSKPVLQFTLDDDLIKEYASVMQVEREKGFNNGNIVNCCNGKYKQAYGFKWKYKE